jgi:uncharacterized membrane-anchored protein YitT (DUF2179 family)
MTNKKDFIIQNILITVGTIFLHVGFYFFFTPNNIVTGGVTGTATILKHFNIPLSLTVLVLNIIFLIIGFIVLGPKYGIKTIYSSLIGPAIIFIFEKTIPPTFFIDKLTETPLLISTLLGSLLTGFGLGIVFRNGGSTGGIDILQNILYEKLHMGYQTVFILTDGAIVLAGLIVFKDLELFLYAIGAVILFSTIIANVSIAGRAGHTLFIVTEKYDEIKAAIHEKLERGTTITDVMGGYSNKVRKLVICVINKRQLNYARYLINEVDPDAFTFIVQTKEAVGLGFSRH